MQRCLIALVAVVLSIPNSLTWADEPLALVKVEETWALTVGEPNLVANAPQVSMVMSSFGDLDEDYFIFLINYRTTPDYAPGGCQVQHWDADTTVGHRDGNDRSPLSNTSEVVRWTQVLTASSGTVTFDVQQGSSVTWGNFAQGGQLRYEIATGQDNLDEYRPQVSIQQSGISYAGNRVSSLTLESIRWTMSDGQVYQLNAPIDIDSDLDPWD